jgi:beta-phosphoglucomutase-like phosphatase (HAD superfamily)
MSNLFKAVIWDVDGVLIDSEPLHLSSFMTTCAGYGFAFDAADNALWIGKSFSDMWQGIPELRSFGLSEIELNNEICDHYVSEVHGGMARLPAPAMVASLAGRGVAQGCASSSPRRIVEANVAAVGVADHLHTVLGRDDVAEGKPAPDLYLLAAKQLGLAPGDCLAIEDTESGLAAAKAAGLTAIVWPNDFNAAMDFSAADHVIEDLAAFDWDMVAGN